MCSAALCAFSSLLPDGVSWHHACCVIRADSHERDSSRENSPGRPCG
jgi:hypothetical protein